MTPSTRWRSAANGRFLELAHPAELLEAAHDALLGPEVAHGAERLDERFLEQGGGLDVIFVGAPGGLRDDEVDDVEGEQVFGGDAQGGGGPRGLRGVLPEDGGAAFRRDDGVDG